jgi:23S rRNA pseudouridine1911/1915/1917 synthase
VIYKISAEENGKTVKEILRYGVGLSLAFTKQLKFLDNGIMLNGEKVTVRRTVSAGDILFLATEDVQKDGVLTPTPLPLDIAYEDEYIVMPNKSADMPTHPSHNHRGDTLADALAYKYQEEGIPFVFRAISRLDRNTSGILLIAKDRISASRLSASMKNGDISKKYIAILDGELDFDEGTIDTYIKREAESIIFRRVCKENEGGDRAITKYKLLAKSNGYSLVLASPITGRTHQLRVHFSHMGAPILGDDMYGNESPLISRHALHALSLEFIHPKTNTPITVCAPPSEDISRVIVELFGSEALSTVINIK